MYIPDIRLISFINSENENSIQLALSVGAEFEKHCHLMAMKSGMFIGIRERDKRLGVNGNEPTCL